jgi:formate dehydrogenase iron-sulfur subunit
MFPPIPNPTTEPVAPTFGEADLIRRSASRIDPPAERQTEVAKLIDVSKCIGCKACQAACLEWNEMHEEIGTFDGRMENPPDLTPASFTVMRYAEYENEDGNLEWLIRKDGCMHCEDPGCLKACPAPGAIVQYSNGIVDFVHENCIGCGYCVKGCPFNIPRLSNVRDRKAYKCTLCVDRVAVGQGPACAKACPTQAIVFGTKDEMKEWAVGRIEDLKSRGFDNAGLYDPPGVGGTHVMYVLQHADRPELYSGLPKDPRISPVVEAWKGLTRYAGLTAIGAFAAIGFLHHMVSGPNRVTEHDEEEAKRLTEGAER